MSGGNSIVKLKGTREMMKFCSRKALSGNSDGNDNRLTPHVISMKKETTIGLTSKG